MFGNEIGIGYVAYGNSIFHFMLKAVIGMMLFDKNPSSIH